MSTDQEETYDDQNAKADAVFDIRGNKFIKRPDDFDFDKNKDSNTRQVSSKNKM